MAVSNSNLLLMILAVALLTIFLRLSDVFNTVLYNERLARRDISNDKYLYIEKNETLQNNIPVNTGNAFTRMNYSTEGQKESFSAHKIRSDNIINDMQRPPYKTRREQPPNANHPILIVAYLRSGSTFVSDVVQHMRVPGVFFVYEPLKYFFDTDGPLEYSPDRLQKDYNRVIESRKMLQYFVKLYNCELDKIPRRFWISKRVKSITTEKFYNCISKHSRTTCLQQSISDCQQSARVIKTIRLSMSAVQYLMERIPKLKVVHLLRDPRGLFHSWVRGNFLFKMGGAEKALPSTCKRIENDCEAGKGLQTRYPHRFRPFLYEDIAEHLKEAVSSLQKLLGITPDSEFNEWFTRHISATKSDVIKGQPKYFSTYRSDPAKTANAWRFNQNFIRSRKISIINQACTNVLTLLGITPEDKTLIMKNRQKSLRYKSEYLNYVQDN